MGFRLSCMSERETMMDEKVIQTLFALIRSAIKGNPMTDEEKTQFSEEMVPDLMKLAQKHDLAHLVGYGVYKNELLEKSSPYYTKMQQTQVMAVFRYEKLNYEFERLCDALEKAEIPFIPLKGAVLRRYYPEPWMRTSCDIDVLVRKETLEAAITYLVENLQYTEKGRWTHDVSLYSPSGIHVELHFDLVEEGRANNAIDVLNSVWEHVEPHENHMYWHEMTDAFFYFYHIAHMAKHFENGGCGIRPFIDLWILDRIKNISAEHREELLKKCGLLQFTDVSRTLSCIWIGNEPMDELSQQMQDFILHGGVYGSSDNRVAIQQKKRGGRLGYLMSRVFIPYVRLKRYYPILEKYRWLTPVMQVRRWFMLLRPDVAKRTKREIAINSFMDQNKVREMESFLDDIGL